MDVIELWFIWDILCGHAIESMISILDDFRRPFRGKITYKN
jgi:hypothetical protein